MSGSKDPINYGTAKGRNHTKADKDDRSHQLLGDKKQKCLLAFHSHCFRGCGDPQETSRQSRMLAHHPTGRPFSVAWVGRDAEKGPPGACPTCSGQVKKLTPWVSEYPRKRRLRNQAAWLFHSETSEKCQTLWYHVQPLFYLLWSWRLREGKWCPRSLARLWEEPVPINS